MESWVTRSDCSACSRRASSSRVRVLFESARISFTRVESWLLLPSSGLAAGEGPAHRLLEIGAAEGLDQVLEGAVGEGVLDRVERGVGGDHDHLDGRIHRLDPLEELDAVHLRHLDVHEHEVGIEGGRVRERRLPLSAVAIS